MITLINSPSIYSCYLNTRKIWINLADIRAIEENQNQEGTTVLTVTWRNGNCDVIGGEDAITILEEWKAASAKLTKVLEDKQYFLMDKRDYSLQVIALGLAIKELVTLGKTNPSFNNLDFQAWLEAIRQQAKTEARNLEYWDISHSYIHDRDTPENKILAAITRPSKTHENQHVLSIF